MGAKIVAKVPSTNKKRLRPSCAECSRKFATVSALTDHKLKVHKKQTKQNIAMKRAMAGPSESAKIVEKALKCHLCQNVFSSRAIMLKHIKDTHASAGSSPESKQSATNDLKCATCTKKFITRKAMLLHICKADEETDEPPYRCSGCKTKIGSLKEMDLHVMSVHNVGVDIVFFNNEQDLQDWKKSEENLTKMHYTVQSDLKHQNKVIYRCAARIKVAKENVKDLCPAAIVVSCANNKIKLAYHKKHYGHPHIEIVSEHDSGQSGDDRIEGNDEEMTEIKIENEFVDTGTDMTEPRDENPGPAVRDGIRELVITPVVERNVSENKTKPLEGKWICLGCKQSFYAIRSLHLHMSNVHSEELFSILFPSEKDFINWKKGMEYETNTKYNEGVKHDLGSKPFNKIYYTCATALEKVSTKDGHVPVCPSTIVTQKYDSGIQIHFYQKHYNHKYNSYVPNEQVKRYQIKNIFEMVGNSRPSLRMDYRRQMFLKFKHLMSNMINVSEQLPAEDLTTLIEKVTPIGLLVDDMVRMKNEPNALTTKRRLDEDPNAAIEGGVRGYKVELMTTATKKLRETRADEARAAKKLRETKTDETETPKKIKEMKPEEVRSSTRIKNRLVSGVTKLTGPPQNDSATKPTKTPMDYLPKKYQKYIHEKMYGRDSSSDSETTASDKSKKTPMDYLPKKYQKYIHEKMYGRDSTSDSEAEMYDSNDDVPSQNDTGDAGQMDDKKVDDFVKPVKKASIENSPSSSTFNDTYKSFIETNNWVNKAKGDAAAENAKSKSEHAAGPKARRGERKVKIDETVQTGEKVKTGAKVKTGEKVKTKLGQFSPKSRNQLSPKSRSKNVSLPVQKSAEKPTFKNVIVERYEVKERDDDCNILILKM